jgi:very-short-patch-repair endonuclease
VANLAARQHGVVAHRQLIELGLRPKAIQYRLATGRLHRVYPGVYAVGHRALSRHGRWLAAVLACGEQALLSHRSAAALWGLRRGAPGRIDVTAPGRSRHGLPGIAVHRVRRLHPDDRARRESIPVASVARTLLDLAEVLGSQELERAFEDAERLRLLDLRAIDGVMRRSRGRRGLRPLRKLLADLAPAPHTRSELERSFVELCRDHELRAPGINALVNGYEVDMLWPEQRVIVELDGHAFHHTRAAFERDRLRDAALQLAGYRVVRLTWLRLAREPAAVADLVRRLLSHAG